MSIFAILRATLGTAGGSNSKPKAINSPKQTKDSKLFLLRTWWAKVGLPWHLVQAHESYNFRLRKGLTLRVDSTQIHCYWHDDSAVLVFATSALLKSKPILSFSKRLLNSETHIFVVIKLKALLLTLLRVYCVGHTSLIATEYFQALPPAALSAPP